MKSRALLATAAATALAAAATPALAHTGQHAGFSLIAGALHPLQGTDHLAQMVLVGLLAARAGGHAFLLLPLTFVSVMIAGAFLVGPSVSSALIDGGILAGLLAAGFLAVSREAVPVPIVVAVIAVSGLLHGMAHGAEAPASSFLPYVAGFAMTTALLHGIGAAFAVHLMRIHRPGFLRVAGAAITVAGVAGVIG